MAENTSNLELYKKTSSDWATDNFNIQLMLNDNWDKVDAFAGDMEEELAAIKNGSALHSIGVPRVEFGSAEVSDRACTLTFTFTPHTVFIYANDVSGSPHAIIDYGQETAYISRFSTVTSASLVWSSTGVSLSFNSDNFDGGLKWMAIGIQPE